MKKVNSKSIHFSIRLDAVLDGQIEAYANANGLEKPEAVRRLLSEKCNDLTADLMQVKTATNITAMEATETRKHVAKMTEILSLKLPAIDKGNEAIANIAKDMDVLGKNLSIMHKSIQAIFNKVEQPKR